VELASPHLWLLYEETVQRRLLAPEAMLKAKGRLLGMRGVAWHSLLEGIGSRSSSLRYAP